MVRYKVGQQWSEDFDYDGLRRKLASVNSHWNNKSLEALYRSCEDINWHNEVDILSKKFAHRKISYMRVMSDGSNAF